MNGLIFFMVLCLSLCQCENVLSNLEINLESKVKAFIVYVSEVLEEFNDDNFGNSDMGKFFHYNEMKRMLGNDGKEKPRHKKMSMMMPLMFQLGAASIWMLVSTILTAKSVAIGLVLLMFKIAVSSAKLSSYLTSLKPKHWGPQEQQWTSQYYE